MNLKSTCANIFVMAENMFSFACADDYGDGFSFSDCYNFTASPLPVPQDPIDEIELYPNFLNDSISLTALDFSTEFETLAGNEELGTRVMLRKRVALREKDQTTNASGDDGKKNGIVGSKKPRTKREGRRPAWSMNHEERRMWRQHEVMRRCSHCETTRTPQWRVGPLGPKTLCNACGVRYKSGRLLPEYRPVASPTFDSHVHSNFHRNILKKKTGTAGYGL